eukprot:5538726-Heterocapsa_arctica.AAC.1
MTRVLCTNKRWASKTNNAVEAQDGLSSSDFVQNDQPSARNLMVIVRMPEDRSNTFNNNETHSTTV